MKKHNSYEEYFLDMVKVFDESSEISQPNKQLDDDFRRIFMDKLIISIKKAWKEYEISQRDTYILTEDELEIVFTQSKEEVVANSLMKLSDLGLVQTGVNINGEITYSLTEKGKDLADLYNEYL